MTTLLSRDPVLALLKVGYFGVLNNILYPQKFTFTTEEGQKPSSEWVLEKTKYKIVSPPHHEMKGPGRSCWPQDLEAVGRSLVANLAILGMGRRSIGQTIYWSDKNVANN